MKHFIIFAAILIVTTVKAQTYSVYQNNGFDPVTRTIYKPGVNLHTSVKPYRLDEVNNYFSVDSLIQRGLYMNPGRHRFWNSVKRIVVYEDLIKWKDDEIFVRINPLFNFEIGKEFSEGKKTWVNTRGVMIEGNLGKNLAFYGDVYESQAVFPQYLSDFICEYDRDKNGNINTKKAVGGRYVVPGFGRMKPYRDGGFDYSQSNGYLSYNAGKWINLQIGYGKNFIGDGYRSLMLSDNAPSYGHIKMTATFWKVKYWWMVGQFHHFNFDERPGIMGVERFPNKYGAFHYLTWNIGKRVSFGIYESVIWSAEDEIGHRGIEMNYLCPFLFYRPAEFNIGSPDNMLVGANLKVIPWKNAALYGQLIFNEFKLNELKSNEKWWGNKYGFQFGFKYYNVFGIRNLDIQTEYNQVRPFTYTWYSPVNNFGHANQELAHPLGANFKENVSVLRYRWKRWHLELQNMIAMHGKDKNIEETVAWDAHEPTKTFIISYGGDIFKSNETPPRYGTYGHKIGQGLKTDILNFSGEISWLINPRTNMNIAIGGRYRKESNIIGDNSNKIFFVTFRTSLRNFYYDF